MTGSISSAYSRWNVELAEVGQTSAVYQAERCHPNDGIRLWPVSSEVPKEGVTWVAKAETFRDSTPQSVWLESSSRS